ncbi:MAG: hypothetical protein WC943_02200, partial [Elusimicrobiota bacterium]
MVATRGSICADAIDIFASSLSALTELSGETPLPASLECVSGGMVEQPVGASMPKGSMSQVGKCGFSKSPRG